MSWFKVQVSNLPINVKKNEIIEKFEIGGIIKDVQQKGNTAIITFCEESEQETALMFNDTPFYEDGQVNMIVEKYDEDLDGDFNFQNNNISTNFISEITQDEINQDQINLQQEKDKNEEILKIQAQQELEKIQQELKNQEEQKRQEQLKKQQELKRQEELKKLEEMKKQDDLKRKEYLKKLEEMQKQDDLKRQEQLKIQEEMKNQEDLKRQQELEKMQQDITKQQEQIEYVQQQVQTQQKQYENIQYNHSQSYDFSKLSKLLSFIQEINLPKNINQGANYNINSFNYFKGIVFLWSIAIIFGIVQ